MQKMAVTTIPITNESTTTRSPQPLLPALLNPYKIKPNPTVDKRTLNTSSFALDVSDTFTKYFSANKMTMATSGIKPINNQRQE
ncbi:hypothetical protein D3C81_1540760 [compost metagenome]